MTQLTIRNKLFLGFGLLLLMMLMLVIVGIQNVNYIDRTLQEITEVNALKQRYAINFRGSVHDRAIDIRDVVLARNGEEIQALKKNINKLAGFYQESESAMQKMMDEGVTFGANERAILSQIETIQSNTLPRLITIIELATQGKRVNAEELLASEVSQYFSDWLKTINIFIDYQEKVNKGATESAREVAGNFQFLMIVITSIAIFIGLIIAIFISRDVTKRLGAEPAVAAKVLADMSSGELVTMHEKYNQDSLMASVVLMQRKLKEIISNIFDASEKLSVETAVVSEGTRNSYNAAQFQAKLTAESSSILSIMREGLNQISTAVTQSEKNSEETSKSAKLGRQKVDESLKEMELISSTVSETVTQIRQLENRTKEIGSIVNVISSISGQTNLLALNAAIEAARAGETGRGFAVVADEVRQLAQRTGEATSQIERMINQVQSETAASVVAMEKTQPLVENGKVLTSETTALLYDIEKQAGSSLLNVKQVAKATGNQVALISDISAAMEKVNVNSKQSIEDMQRNNQVTQTLNELSTRLKTSIGYFNIGA